MLFISFTFYQKSLSLSHFCLHVLFQQPLARLGADVTGIDAVEKNINIARVHAVM